ncbi:hypothetical protein HZP91_15305 [Elizabethkingia anophelis]|nr:hypothetical protein [Elizabethkingia anophelis]
MENNLENKAMFFAQYWGQKIMIWGESELFPPQKVGVSYMTKYGVSNRKLELKNIDDITDKEAEMLGFDNAAHFFSSGSVYSMKDELRRLGFAVEWSEWSVDELINFGWVKLKDKNDGK